MCWGGGWSFYFTHIHMHTTHTHTSHLGTVQPWLLLQDFLHKLNHFLVLTVVNGVWRAGKEEREDGFRADPCVLEV